MGTARAPEEVGTAGTAGEEAWTVGCLQAETAGTAAQRRRRQAQPRSGGDGSREEASGGGDGREAAGGKQSP